MPGVIGAQLDNGAPWLREGNLGARDWQAVFVEHSESDSRARRLYLSACRRRAQ